MMQRDPHITRMIKDDPDAGREVLLAMLRHSARCDDCPVIELIRKQVMERKRRGFGKGDGSDSSA